MTTFQHCLEAIRNGGHVEIVPHDLAAFNNYLQWFHESTRIELVNHAYDDDILDDPIAFDEVAQSQYDRTARQGRSTSIASSLNFVVMYSLISYYIIYIGMCSLKLCIICLSQRSEIQKTATECEVVWDQSHRDEKPIGPMRHFIKVWSPTLNVSYCVWRLCNHDFHDAEHCTEVAAVSQVARLPRRRNCGYILF